MDTNRTHIIEIFSELGVRLAGFGETAITLRVIAEACRENPWFLPSDILKSVEAITSQMLDRRKLMEWAGSYPNIEESKRVRVIMAGNIPLVGFFDMMCVLVSGHICEVKPSSKDRVLMEYIIDTLRGIDPQIGVCDADDHLPDAVIATGSDNTKRYFKALYTGIPSILRGSRYSVAVLTGNESVPELSGLSKDIFSYSGLGCRNVSMVFVPENYDETQLVEVLSRYTEHNPKYINNFRQRKAMLEIEGKPFLHGTHFLLHEGQQFPAYISEVTLFRYKSPETVVDWLAGNDDKIQCVVQNPSQTGIIHSRTVAFGQAQMPGLTDYADDIDVMEFLSEI